MFRVFFKLGVCRIVNIPHARQDEAMNHKDFPAHQVIPLVRSLGLNRISFRQFRTETPRSLSEERFRMRGEGYVAGLAIAQRHMDCVLEGCVLFRGDRCWVLWIQHCSLPESFDQSGTLFPPKLNWQWVENRCPKWTPGKWSQCLEV